VENAESEVPRTDGVHDFARVFGTSVEKTAGAHVPRPFVSPGRKTRLFIYCLRQSSLPSSMVNDDYTRVTRSNGRREDRWLIRRRRRRRYFLHPPYSVPRRGYRRARLRRDYSVVRRRRDQPLDSGKKSSRDRTTDANFFA